MPLIKYMIAHTTQMPNVSGSAPETSSPEIRHDCLTELTFLRNEKLVQ